MPTKKTFKSTLSLENKTMAEHSNSTRVETKIINEVDMDKQQIENETGAAMKKRFAKSIRESYKRSSITFILWMFDHHIKYPSLMQPML